MKKIVVTRENYEEIMFGLLENEFEPAMREDILNQIEADTFLAFEWKQWSKANFTESLETYKSQEAEFIESLVKEDKKAIIFPIYRQLSWAAVIALFIGLGLVLYNSVDKQVQNVSLTTQNSTILPTVAEQKSEPDTVPLKFEKYTAITKKESRINSHYFETNKPDTVITKNELLLVKETPETDLYNDTVQQMIATAIKQNKQSRFKITVTESTMDGRVTTNYSFSEKRYTMADVINHKDGITLSKFLDNGTSRVIKSDNKTYIEYIAQDNSVLILTLSN